jgi:transposase-like protein
VKNAPRPAIFKWRQTAPELILCAVRWYLRYSLSLRDAEELFAERGVEADHTTIWRWVQRYGPELEQRLRGHLKPTNKSWRVDETYIRVQGRWCYLYRAIDSSGATIDFLLSALRDAAAAKCLFRKALSDPAHPQPRVINTDKARLYEADGQVEVRLRNGGREGDIPEFFGGRFTAVAFTEAGGAFILCFGDEMAVFFDAGEPGAFTEMGHDLRDGMFVNHFSFSPTLGWAI